MVEYPGLVYTIAYQDGLRHGFEYYCTIQNKENLTTH